MRYDVPLKELFHQAPQQLLQILTGCQALELLNLEYPAVKSRRPDLVARLTDGRIYHLELQTQNDENMLWRMLEYYTLIYQDYGVAPLQQVLYVGKDKANFTTHYQTENLSFRYELKDIRELDCHALLQSDSLADNVLAVLCRLDKPAQVLRTILSRIDRLDDKSRKDMLLILASLTNLRGLNPLLQQEEQQMSIEISIENNLFMQKAYRQGQADGEQKGKQEGEQKGKQEGKREGKREGKQEGEANILCRLLEKKFGPLSPKLRKKIKSASVEDLEKWTDRLFEAQSLDELLG